MEQLGAVFQPVRAPQANRKGAIYSGENHPSLSSGMTAHTDQVLFTGEKDQDKNMEGRPFVKRRRAFWIGGLLGAFGLATTPMMMNKTPETGQFPIEQPQVMETVTAEPAELFTSYPSTFQPTLQELNNSAPVAKKPARVLKNGDELTSIHEALSLILQGQVKEAHFQNDGRLASPRYQFELVNGIKVTLNQPQNYDDDLRLREALSERSIPLSQSMMVEDRNPLLVQLLPTLLLLGGIGGFAYLRHRQQQNMINSLGQNDRTKVKGIEADRPKTRFTDVLGYPELIDELKQLLIDFKSAEAPKGPLKLHAKRPKGALLYGPPGTGKTLMARAIAGEAGVPFYKINGSELVEMFVGVGAARIRSIFQQARRTGGIVFIDEIDSFGKKRDGAGTHQSHSENEQTLNQLLGEMNGFDEHSNVMVIAATNRPDLLDPALLRPGRFDKKIHVDRPRKPEHRMEILEHYLSQQPVDPAISRDDLLKLSRLMQGKNGAFAGAEIENVVKEATSLAIRNKQDRVTRDNLYEAIKREIMGIPRPSLGSPEERKLTAVHEFGHAMMTMANRMKFFIISMFPAGEALGFVIPDAEGRSELSISKKQMLQDVLLASGGRAAEEQFLGPENITTGWQGDMQQIEQRFKMLMTGGLLNGQVKNFADPFNPAPINDKDRVLMNRLIQNGIEASKQILERVPQDKYMKLVEASLRAGDLMGDEAMRFIQEKLGPDFDWQPIYEIAERFVQDPLNFQKAA